MSTDTVVPIDAPIVEAAVVDAPLVDDAALVEDELLVEEISIDGMCGVY